MEMGAKVQKPLFSFALITDVQFADIENGYSYDKTRRRFYRNSIRLLTDAVKEWNQMSPSPAFLIQLGDLIDGKNNKHEGMSVSSWQKCVDALSTFHGPIYHVFGNHDFYNFTHSEFAEMLPGMTLQNNGPLDHARLRYTFSPHEKYMFTVLDTYEVSMLGYNKDEEEFLTGRDILLAVNKNKDLNSRWGLTADQRRFVQYNGAVGPRQLEWLDKKLAEATGSGQTVIIFTHVQLTPPDANTVWDSEDVMRVLHRYRCVAAVIAGHDHDGGYIVDDTGIHHITLPGVIETLPDDQAYATMHVYRTHLELEGVGRRMHNATIPLPQ